MVEARGMSTYNKDIGEFESASEVVIWEKDSWEFFTGNEVTEQMSQEDVEKYIQQNPFPMCNDYSAEAFIEDILACYGSSLVIPTTQKEVVEYVVNFINSTCE